MISIIVVEERNDWPLEIADVEVVLASDYLMRDDFKKKNIRVFNLCRSYRYQSLGYYVSLLATARSHRPSPSIETIQDMKSVSFVRIASDNLDELIHKSLKGIKSEHFELSIYFGENMAKRYEALCKELNRIFLAPMVRAYFKRSQEKWILRKIQPIGLKDVPSSHLGFVANAARLHFKRRQRLIPKSFPRFSLAILLNSQEAMPPSNAKAIKKFVKAAHKLDMEVEMIDRDDFSYLSEFDGLFIRETTSVNHYTFRFAQKAQALGLVVIDDPVSILKCTNKVYLNEVLARHKLPFPQTTIISRQNYQDFAHLLRYPCILKQPDSSFSQGVLKVESADEYLHEVVQLLKGSELILAQEFVPTDFDWRVGVFDGEPLYVCKYYMAQDHWQIYKRDHTGKVHPGWSETLDVEAAPKKLIELALKASRYVGDGLYGLDIKQANDRFSLIEINDNPNLDAGIEDERLGDELYMRIMQVFLKRMMHKAEGNGHVKNC